MKATVQELVRDALASLLLEMASGLAPEVVEEQRGVPPVEETLAAPLVTAKGAVGYGSASVYVAGCSSLEALSKCLGLPIFKIGTTRQSMVDRQNALRGDRYGAAIKRGDVVILDAGYDDWEMKPMRASPATRLMGGDLVRVLPTELQVSLTMPFAAFEGAVRTMLRQWSLADWITSTAGKRHMGERGMKAADADRFTVYRYGTADDRVCRCTELYIIKPREHLPKLVADLRRILEPCPSRKA